MGSLVLTNACQVPMTFLSSPWYISSQMRVARFV